MSLAPIVKRIPTGFGDMYFEFGQLLDNLIDLPGASGHVDTLGIERGCLDSGAFRRIWVFDIVDELSFSTLSFELSYISRVVYSLTTQQIATC